MGESRRGGSGAGVALPPDLWGGALPGDGPHIAGQPGSRLGAPASGRRERTERAGDARVRPAGPDSDHSRRPGPEAAAAWRLLERVSARVGGEIDAALAERGLPPRAWLEVLTALDEAPRRRLRHGELASITAVSPGGLTRLVDRMSGGGLVERRRREDDRRGADVVLTALGAETARRMAAVQAEVIEGSFAAPLGVYASGVRDALASVLAGRGTRRPVSPHPTRV